MKRPTIPIVAGVLCFAIVALLVYGITARGGDETLDDAIKRGDTPTAPGATMSRPNLGADGTTTLASMRGKIVVLNFWASWCLPCLDEAPVLERTQKALTASGTGTVLGATYNDTVTDSQAFIRKAGLTYPNVRDMGNDLAREYGTISLPETFVINPEGKIVAIARGQISKGFLEKAIAKAKVPAR